jgi:hypothetical protein
MYVLSNKKKCQNKWEQLLEKNPIIVGTILCAVSNKNKCSVKTNQNKGQNKLLLLTEQDAYSQHNLLF